MEHLSTPRTIQPGSQASESLKIGRRLTSTQLLKAVDPIGHLGSVSHSSSGIPVVPTFHDIYEQDRQAETRMVDESSRTLLEKLFGSSGADDQKPSIRLVDEQPTPSIFRIGHVSPQKG